MAKKSETTSKEIDPRMKQIGNKIKQLRVDKGYTNYENLAWESGIGRMQYWRLESGKNFTMGSLFKVLDAHGMSLSEFFADFTEVHEKKET